MALKMVCARVVCARYVCAVVCLFEADGADDKCNAGYLFNRDVERWVVFIVGHSREATFMLARHEPFDEYALFARGDDVAFVPLQELLFVEYCASDDVTWIKVRVHGKAGDLNHEVNAAEAELGDDVILLDVLLGYGEELAAKPGGGCFSNQRYGFYLALFCYFGKRYDFMLARLLNGGFGSAGSL